MVGIALAAVAASIILVWTSSAVGQPVEFPEPVACPVVEDLGLAPDDDRAWSGCEKWAWSCIRYGREANFFAKKCVELRSREANELRARFRYAPFRHPDSYREANGIGGPFLYAILTKEQYVREIHPAGVRLVGAYFDRQVNLENVTTDKNLVFDQAMFKAGLRLTNFKTEKNFSLDGSNVRGRIYLLRAVIQGTLFMEEGAYDLVDAADARIGASIDAPNSIFNAPFRLDRVKVEGKVNLIRARLTEFTAWDTTIGSKLEFRYAHVRGRIDLTGTTIHGDLRMQRMEFGRALEVHETLLCDWDLTEKDRRATNRFFLNPEHARLAGNRALHDELVHEAIATRPDKIVSGDRPCLKSQRAPASPAGYLRETHHEVLLRDMRIGGALCLIDLTGEIRSMPPVTRPRRHLSSISLDGTDARSTIIRWKDSDSDTLWQAVHFKTKNLFIDLSSQPRRHFLDNIEIGNVSFIRPLPPERELEEQDEESRAYLCDVRPGPGARFASDEAETHKRIAAFFKSAANEAQSPQPFGEIVARLNESNSSSLALKMELSEYKLGKACTSSEYYKKMMRPAPPSGPAGGTEPEVAASAISARDGEVIAQSIEESRKILLDSACFAGLKAFKYGAAYGHQPHNILLLMAAFITVFRLLLLFDKALPGQDAALRRRQLGILYSVDMFTPFVKLLPQHRRLRPNTGALRGYLVFHRVLGLVLTGLLAIGIYAARF